MQRVRVSRLEPSEGRSGDLAPKRLVSILPSQRICNITVFLHPALGLEVHPQKGNTRIPYQTVTNTPNIISQVGVATMLGQDLSDLEMSFSISVIDMRAERSPGSLKKVHYKRMPYANGTANCYRVGSLDFEDVKEEIRSSDVICLTCNFTTESAIVSAFIKYCKETNPDVKIVIGGRDAAARTAYYLNAGADVIILGYGEGYGAEAIKRLFRRESLEGIPGIVTSSMLSDSSNHLGAVNTGLYRSQIAPRREEMHSIYSPGPSLRGSKMLREWCNGEHPLEFDLVDISLYKQSMSGELSDGVRPPLMNISFSRGCTGGCKFCSTSGEHYDALNIDDAGLLLWEYRKAGMRSLVSNEDNFLARVKLGLRWDALMIARLIMSQFFAIDYANGLQMSLFGTKKGDKFVIDEELLEAVLGHIRLGKGTTGRLLGCYGLYWPLETFREDTRARENLRKLLTWEEQLQLIEAVAKLKIPKIGFGIIIFHDYSRKDIKDLVRKAREIKRLVIDRSQGQTNVHFSIFNEIFAPGAPNFLDPDRRVLIQHPIDVDPELWGAYTPAYEGTVLSLQNLFDLRRRAAIAINT